MSNHSIHEKPTPLTTPLKIGIAGGGLLGRLSAWQLARQGHDVALFESHTFDHPKGACWTAAGMISPLSEIVHCPLPIYEMGMRSLEIWPRWMQTLQNDLNNMADSLAETNTALKFAHLDSEHLLYRQAGSLVVAHPQDWAELSQFRADLKQKLSSLNPSHQTASAARPQFEARIEDCNQQRLAALEPALEHFQQGLYLTQEADIDNRRLLNRLLSLLKALNVNLIENTPVMCAPHIITTLHSNHPTSHTFDCVIDCRGLGAQAKNDELSADRTCKHMLRGVRGEVLMVQSSEITLNRPVRLMHPRYKLYVVPKPNQHFVIGATEIESDDMSPMSLQSNLELSSALYTINPAFSEARIIEQSVNCRPAFMDNLPRVQSQDGLISANGLYRHGYLLSPVIVEDVLSQLTSLMRPTTFHAQPIS